LQVQIQHRGFINMTKFVKFVRDDGVIEYRNENYDQLIQEQHTPPSEILEIPQEEIDQYFSKMYKIKRQPAYPPIVDQLDALYKDIESGKLTTEGSFYQMIKAIKDQYPKT